MASRGGPDRGSDRLRAVDEDLLLRQRSGGTDHRCRLGAEPRREGGHLAGARSYLRKHEHRRRDRAPPPAGTDLLPKKPEVADKVDRPRNTPGSDWPPVSTGLVWDWETTEQDLRDSFDLYKRLGDARQMEENLGTTGQMLTAQGRFAEVYQIGEQLKDSGSGRDDAQGEFWGWLFQGTSLLRRGDYRTALSRFRHGGRFSMRGSGRSMRAGSTVSWRRPTGASMIRNGPGSRSLGTQALYAERPGVVFALDGFTGVADVYLGQWETGRARRCRRQVGRRARREEVAGIQQGLPDRSAGRPSLCWRGQGTSGRRRGSPQSEQGIEIAADLQMPYEEGRLRLSLGRLSKDRAQLETARDLFESSGAAPFSDAARSALREI